MKAKKPFMAGYKTYDASAGFGKERDWRNTFRAAMGADEAADYFAAKPEKGGPLAVLGLDGSPTWNAIKTAYRAMSRKFHPDFNQGVDTTERMKDINAAYVLLERQHGKG